MSKFCYNCGSELNTGFVFCNKCGAKISIEKNKYSDEKISKKNNSNRVSCYKITWKALGVMLIVLILGVFGFFIISDKFENNIERNNTVEKISEVVDISDLFVEKSSEEQDDSKTQSSTNGVTVNTEDFIKMTEGIWVNSDSYYDMEYGFDFCSFRDGSYSEDVYPGCGISGEIKSIVQLEEKTFLLNVFFPDMDNVYSGSYRTISLTFFDNYYVYTENPSVKYVYMGNNLDEVIAHSDSYVSTVNTNEENNTNLGMEITIKMLLDKNFEFISFYQFGTLNTIGERNSLNLLMVNDPRIKTWKEFKDYVNNLYSYNRAYCITTSDNKYWGPYGDNGALYVYPENITRTDYSISWSTYTISINSQGSSTCDFTVTDVKSGYKTDGRAVKENGKWLLECEVY